MKEKLTDFLETAKTYWMNWATVVVVTVASVVLLVLVRNEVILTGFEGKTVWDWLDVLAVPIAVVWIVGLFGFARQKADQKAEAAKQSTDDRAEVEALRTYLDRIQELVAGGNFFQTESGSAARAVARARTFAVLRELNGTKKGILIQFLYEAGLILGSKPVIGLEHADLRGTDLVGADLPKINLSGANLTKADLGDANFNESYLDGTILTGSKMSNANLEGASVTNDQLSTCWELFGAVLPDGRIVDEVIWDDFLANSEAILD